MNFFQAQAPPPPPAAASAPPPPPPKPAAPAQTVPIAAIRHAQAIDAATVKLPPADYTKEITGTRTEQRVKMNRMRLKIASRLKEAQNTNAMLTTFNEIDMSYIMEFRKLHQEAFLKKYGIKLGFMSAFAKATAYALQDQPTVNAVIEENVRFYRRKMLKIEISFSRKLFIATTSTSPLLLHHRKVSSCQFCVTSSL